MSPDILRRAACIREFVQRASRAAIDTELFNAFVVCKYTAAHITYICWNIKIEPRKLLASLFIVAFKRRGT